MAPKPKAAPTLERQVYLIDRRIKLGKLSLALLSQLLAQREALVRRMDKEFGPESDDSMFTDEQRRVLGRLTGKALVARRESFRIEAQRSAHRKAIAALAKSHATPKPSVVPQQAPIPQQPSTPAPSDSPAVSKPDPIFNAALIALAKIEGKRLLEQQYPDAPSTVVTPPRRVLVDEEFDF